MSHPRHVLFEAGGLALAVPADAVQAIHDELPLQRVEGTRAWFLGLAVADGRLLPVTDLGAWLGVRASGGRTLQLHADVGIAGFRVDVVYGLSDADASVSEDAPRRHVPRAARGRRRRADLVDDRRGRTPAPRRGHRRAAAEPGLPRHRGRRLVNAPGAVSRPATRASESGWRQILPRVLLALALVLLLVSLAVLQRGVGLVERRLAAAGTSEGVPGIDAARVLPAGEGGVAGTVDALLERGLDRIGLPPSRLALVALALGALAAALALWLGIDAGRRRELRERADDGRTRREQAAILALLDEIAPLASGDLRVRATVSEAMTGALADAFNHAVAELRWLVGTIDGSALRVGDAVTDSRESAQRLVGACTVQAREIHRSSNYLAAMSETMAQLSAHATECSRIATVSVGEAEAGGRAIRESVERLSRIRDEAELATRLMQRLAENASTIDERVETIRDVARRTDLLALNTTIRAAASAASGFDDDDLEADDTFLDGTLSSRGRSASGDLSRLSHEVTQLADLLGGAARDIASLSRTIRQDADDTVRAMDETNRELAAGLAQSEQASGSLESIESVSRELRELVGDMAEKTLRQSGVVRQLSTNMTVINRITTDTSNEVQATAGALDQLNALALELRDGVADFRLPPPPREAAESATEAAAARTVTREAMRSSTRATDHG